jgi:hypothetical protein
VTEDEWLTCTDPRPMLEFLRGKVSERKLRLLMAAACRRVLHLLDEPQYVALVEAGERVADGTLRPASLARYRTNCPPISLPDFVQEETRWQEHSHEFNGPLLAKRAVWLSGSRDRHRVEECLLYAARGLHARHSIQDEMVNQCHLPKLAQAIYDERAFDRLPVLADALEEAGGDNADMLNHCRLADSHVRGCWLLDLLLGKK